MTDGERQSEDHSAFFDFIQDVWEGKDTVFAATNRAGVKLYSEKAMQRLIKQNAPSKESVSGERQSASKTTVSSIPDDAGELRAVVYREGVRVTRKCNGEVEQPQPQGQQPPYKPLCTDAWAVPPSPLMLKHGHDYATCSLCGEPCQAVEVKRQQAESPLEQSMLHMALLAWKNGDISMIELKQLLAQREQAGRLDEVTRMSNDEVWPMTLSLWEYQKLRIKELKQHEEKKR